MTTPPPSSDRLVRPERMIHHRRKALAAAGPVALMLLIWVTVAAVVNRDMSAGSTLRFPMPWETIARTAALLGGDRLLDFSLYVHVFSSLLRWVAGFAIAAVCGLAFGLAAGWWRGFERLSMPTVHVLQLIPGLAWIPVAILLFGIGEGATIFMIAVTAFTPIAINVVSGVKNVDETTIRAARMLGSSQSVLFHSVLAPAALPQILSGLRIGLGNGWRVLVAAEMVVGTGTGLGYSINHARQILDYPSAFVCILIICLIGLVIERFGFAFIERRTIQRWGLGRTVEP